MKRSALLLLGLLTSLAAQAQIYQYKDAAGKTVISDRPPPATAKGVRTVESEDAPTTGGNTSKSLSEREMDFKKRQQTQQEKAAKDQKEKNAADARKENCDLAQRQLQALESGQRIATQDDKGERSFVDETQRAKEMERARKIASENCK
jgi:hypothetical protein